MCRVSRKRTCLIDDVSHDGGLGIQGKEGNRSGSECTALAYNLFRAEKEGKYGLCWARRRTGDGSDRSCLGLFGVGCR